MTRRKAAAAIEGGAEPGECLLCGAATPVFVDPDDEAGLAVFDLCGRCNSAFAALARDLERAAEARSRRVEIVTQVAGQLELGEQDPSCRWAHGECGGLDSHGLCAVCAEDEA